MSARNDDAGSTTPIDRRAFLAASGATLATALTPLASLVPAVPVAAAVTGPTLLADWTIDDMWGAYPRYAEPIGFARVRHESGPSSDDATLTGL